MICVPRILNRIYHQVIRKVKGSWVKSRVLNVAMKSKSPEIAFNENLRNSIWNKLIFKTVQQLLGGKMKLLISGSNLISETIFNFIRNSLHCTVLQSYDITECSSFVTLTGFSDQHSKDLGPPLACNTIKLISVPELNIHPEENNIGEICVKGTNVFSGYYKDHATYQQKFDEDGWFHTGDIGKFTENGRLKYIDRIQDIFLINKNNSLKWVGPNKIENVYIQSNFVGQCFVFIDSHRNYLIAVIVPDIDGINRWCNENNLLLSAAEACKNTAFRSTLTDDLKSIAIRERLKPFEQVDDVFLYPDSFTQEADLLTPTMKLKRFELHNYFRHEIDNIIMHMFNKTSKIVEPNVFERF
ncbi:Actin-related protein 2/3 complex subunit 5 [Sarcoptes scabiei]|nr:Actin-related protein 2/3 complex subunit 5 [Sarcoptes scabiei]